MVGMVVVKRNGTLLVATDKGFGKRSEIGDYRLTKRGAKGVITLKTSDRVGHMLAIMEVGDDDDLMIITQQGVMIRLPIKDVRVIGRATQGVKLIRLDKGDQISSITNVVTNDDEDKETGDGDILDEGIEEDQAEPTVDE